MNTNRATCVNALLLWEKCLYGNAFAEFVKYYSFLNIQISNWYFTCDTFLEKLFLFYILTFILFLSNIYPVFQFAVFQAHHSNFSQRCVTAYSSGPTLSLSFIRQLHWILPELLLLWCPWSKNMSAFYFWSSLLFVVQGGRSTVKPYEDATEIGTPGSNCLSYRFRKDTKSAWSSLPKSRLSCFDLWTWTENTH